MAVVHGFAALPARPPTPPREHDDRSPIIEVDLPTARVSGGRSSISTPDESPESATEYFPSSSIRASKRVGFSLEKNDFLPFFSTSTPRTLPLNRANPSSRDSKPGKSILKQTNHQSSDPVDFSSPAVNGRGLPGMLDDLARQLAAPSQSSRLDAYMSLNQCLKAYKNMPEQQALEEKMPLLSDFIRRDLADTKAAEGPRSTQLATEVVRLVTTLLWSPNMSESFSDTFQCFVLDQSISEIGNEQTPKVLVNQYLHLLSLQNFRGKIMTSDRAGRLVKALKQIHERVKGRQLLAHRLDIYKRLLHQARHVMVARFRDWYECIFYGMLASTKEIRLRALSLGFEAGVELGAEDSTSKAVKDLFAKTASEDFTEGFGDTVCTRLTSWLASKEDARLVPQIWSVVVLFLRRTFERWAFTVSWLRLLQKCFNSSDMEVRFQANRAWARLVFAVNPDIHTTDHMVALLRDPLRVQLDRLRSVDKNSKKTRLSIYAAYFALLYYSFRPGADAACLDRYWKACVQPFIAVKAGAIPTLEIGASTGVLVSLLGEQRQKPWLLNRAIESAPIKPDEIPSLEPKWIRSRAALILEVVEPLLLSEMWWTTESEQPPILRIWHTLADALAAAASKEVKVSMDAVNAIAVLLGTMHRFYTETRKNGHAALKRYSSMVDILVKKLGHHPLTEKRLVHVRETTFQAAETPSSRAKQKHNLVASPVHFLLAPIFSKQTPQPEDTLDQDKNYRAIASTLTATGQSVASSRLSKLKGLLDILSCIEADDTRPASRAEVILWEVVVDAAVTAIKSPTTDISIEGSVPAGQDFKEVVKLLNIGAQLGSDALTPWERLLSEVDRQIRKECGKSAFSLAVLEPMVHNIMDESDSCKIQDNLSIIFRQVTAMIELALWPENRKELEGSMKLLCNSALPQSPPFGLLYKGITSLVEISYWDFHNESPVNDLVMMIQAVSSLISKAPSMFYTQMLTTIQFGLAYWIADREGALNCDGHSLTLLFQAFLELWTRITNRIKASDKFDQDSLDSLEPLLIAGLSSRHRAFANKTIDLWNSTFGLVEGLEYTRELRQTLLRLKSITEICTCSHIGDNTESEYQHNYLDTPEVFHDQETAEFQSPAGRRAEVHDRFSILPKQNIDQDAKVKLEHQSDEKSHTPKRPGKSPQPGSTPRLRHDDSQIQFAAIDSSPVHLDAMDSQLLTDRQKEVKARQQNDAAAMFSDISSSARPKSLSQDLQLPRLELNEHTLDSSEIEDNHSPTLPPPGATAFLGSSPTPSQRRSSSRDKFSANGSSSAGGNQIVISEPNVPIDPPSSPPIVSRENCEAEVTVLAISGESSEPMTVNNAAIGTRLRKRRKGPSESEQSVTMHVANMDDVTEAIADKRPAAGQLSLNLEDELEPAQDCPEADRSIGSNETAAAPVRVNALHEKSNDVAAVPNTVKSMARATSLEQIASPNIEKQIQAQIFIDLERSMSQSRSASDAAEDPSEKADAPQNGRKRKAPLLPAGGRPSKRTRGRPRKSIEPVPIKEDSAVEDEPQMLDCIYVVSPSDELPDQDVSQEPVQAKSKKVSKSSKSSGKVEADSVQATRKKVLKSPKTAGKVDKLKRKHGTLTESSIPADSAAPNKSKRTRTLRNRQAEKSAAFDEAAHIASSPSRTGPEREQGSVSVAEQSPDLSQNDPPCEAAMDIEDTAITAQVPETTPAAASPQTPSLRPEAELKNATVGGTGSVRAASPLIGEGAVNFQASEPPSTSTAPPVPVPAVTSFLFRVKQLLVDARNLVLTPEEGDEVVSSLMDTGKVIMDARRRRT